MIKENDLRIGNVLYYETPEGETEPIVIHWQHIKWITDNPIQFNLVHSPIELTIDILERWGAIEKQHHWFLDDIDLAWITTDEYFEIEWYTPSKGWKIKSFKYAHDLQNFYFAITGKEITL